MIGSLLNLDPPCFRVYQLDCSIFLGLMSSECSSPFSRLSQEVSYKIIDHIVDDEDSPRFREFVNKHCALVSRSFRPRSGFHIFGTLYLFGWTDGLQRKLQTLAKLIRGNPKIADYIRELSLMYVGLEYSWIGANRWFNDGYGIHRFDNTTEFQSLLDNFF